MAEVVFLGFGPLIEPPNSVTPPNDEVSFVPGLVAVPSGTVVGQVATVSTPDANVNVRRPPSDIFTTFTAGTPPPSVVGNPATSGVNIGPALSIAPFSTTRICFFPGTVQQFLAQIGNQAETAVIPPFQLTTSDRATLTYGMQVFFLDVPGVNTQLRGQSYNITAFTEGTDVGGGVIRDTLTVDAMPVANGPVDYFLVRSRYPQRLTPVLDINLG